MQDEVNDGGNTRKNKSKSRSPDGSNSKKKRPIDYHSWSVHGGRPTRIRHEHDRIARYGKGFSNLLNIIGQPHQEFTAQPTMHYSVISTAQDYHPRNSANLSMHDDSVLIAQQPHQPQPNYTTRFPMPHDPQEAIRLYREGPVTALFPHSSGKPTRARMPMTMPLQDSTAIKQHITKVHDHVATQKASKERGRDRTPRNAQQVAPKMGNLRPQMDHGNKHHYTNTEVTHYGTMELDYTTSTNADHQIDPRFPMIDRAKGLSSRSSTQKYTS